MGESVAQLCSRLVRIDTTNRARGDAVGEREAAEFVAGFLADEVGLDPQVLESAPRRANVVARFPGSDPSLAPVLAHAHLDVVPADPELWTVPPFSGEIRDGYVWGRGSVDMKDMVATLLATVRDWRATGRAPRRDLVLAFVADEETGGDYGARWLATEHPELFAGCALAIGEGGGFAHDIAGPTRDVRLYPIGTAERGTLHIRFTATGRAGHGSRPNTENAVVTLVRALARIADHRWPVQLTEPVRAYLEQTGTALGVPVDLSSDEAVDATVDRLGGAGGLAAATVRCSSQLTALSAGSAVNVVPSRADALVDVRVLPGVDQEVLAVLDGLVGPGVRREFVTTPALPVSAPLDGPWFTAMADALRAEDPSGVVVPYCLGGGTDAKSFAPLGIPCYAFSPLGPAPDRSWNHRAMAHGVDERVPVAGLEFGVRVLDRFLIDL